MPERSIDAEGASAPGASARLLINAAIADLSPWFHNLHLPGDIQTAPDHSLGDFPANQWQYLREHLPRDLSGWQALDIGCNAGYYCFELARMGAQVTGIDSNDHYLRQARWAAEKLDLTAAVRFIRMPVYGLARMSERFDLVLFMGVFYHLRYPLLALDLAARKTKRLMIFQTMTTPGRTVYEPGPDRPLSERVDMLRPDWPKMAFIEHKMAGDPSNWWVANHAAVLAMLRSSGLHPIHRPASEMYIAEPASPAEAVGDRRWTADFIETQLNDIFGPGPQQG